MPATDHRVVLTDNRIKALKPAPKGKRYQVMDQTVAGFGVRVTDTGVRTFILRTRYPGATSAARREIGKADSMTLADARDKARAWVKLIAAGIDPAVQAERNRAAEQRKVETTFGAVAEDFIRDKLPEERKAKDAEREIRRELLPTWGKRPISDISDDDVIRLLKAKARKFPVSAKNLFALIKRFFRWAISQRAYGITVSPCASIVLKHIIGDIASVREHVLSDAEFWALWRASGRIRYPCGAVYRLLALTALRLREVSEAEWAEFDPDVVRALRQRKDGERIAWENFSKDKLIWVIPASRMKGKNAGIKRARPHSVPLTAEILSVLESVPMVKGARFVFSTSLGAKPIWMGAKVKTAIDARMLRSLRAFTRKRGDDAASAVLEHWTNHDIRRTVRSHLSRLKISEESREAVLAHVRPGIKGVYDKYDYFDEKSEALQLWAARLRDIVEPAPNNVIRLAAKS